MTLVFPRFRQCLFSLTNMADRESSSENYTRARSVQDFVRTVLHAVTNLQTQSRNPNRAENSSSAEFSSAEEEINARFQIPRHRRGIPNRSATSINEGCSLDGLQSETELQPSTKERQQVPNERKKK